ncbi:MAG TPA: S8 family serine peptidase, partial [Verrucomicrobiae bacterium]|nr:S8 family serine peptidase [Verrucomicrobiae bacterium]
MLKTPVACLLLFSASLALAASPMPAIEPGVAEAVEGGHSVVVNIVLRGGHALPPSPSASDERDLLDSVAAAHRAFRGALPAHGVRVLREHTYAAGSVAEIDADGLEALAKMPQVESVYLDGTVHALDTEGNALIGSTSVNAGGYTGAGMAVAIVDTGIDYTHPALGGCLGNVSSCRVKGGFDFVNNDSDPMDDNGHGTECSGVAGANSGSLKGVAPGVNFVGLKVLAANGSGSFSAIDSALNWVLTNRVGFNIKVVSMSLGDGSQHNVSTGSPCGSS